MAEFQSTTDFQLQSVIISPSDGSKGYQVKQLVQIFSYIENIEFPVVMATLVVVDSGGLLNKLPIQGGEIVKIKVKTSVDKEGVEYTMRIWKIANRYVKNQDQAYTLGLISEEALNNEFARIETPLEGTPDKIIAKMLKETLKTSKPFYSEPCLFSTRLIAARRRIFDIVSLLMSKSVPKLDPKVQTSSDKLNSSTKNQEQKVSGSAGYFFWENRRGFNFFSIDTLCSDKPTEAYDNSKPWGPYVEKVVNQSDGADDRFTIITVTYQSEIDLVAGLRMGRYATKMCFFNHSTGQYDEYLYSLKDAFDDMKHLGSQTEPSLIKLGKNKTLSDYPTGLMSMLLDHETWYNEATPASPYSKDGSTSPSPYAERHLEYAAQSIVRYDTLSNQKATIVIPGNSLICAGDKIDIRIINKLPSEDAKKEVFDKENSGVYLVMEVTHEYNTLSGANGKFITTLRVARDTHGMKDKISEHGTK
jgi:hypothetical protein